MTTGTHRNHGNARTAAPQGAATMPKIGAAARPATANDNRMALVVRLRRWAAPAILALMAAAGLALLLR